jgi:hypothetical protein
LGRAHESPSECPSTNISMAGYHMVPQPTAMVAGVTELFDLTADNSCATPAPPSPRDEGPELNTFTKFMAAIRLQVNSMEGLADLAATINNNDGLTEEEKKTLNKAIVKEMETARSSSTSSSHL